jgi:hypothetical protein
VDVVLEVKPFAVKHGEKEGLWKEVEKEQMQEMGCAPFLWLHRPQWEGSAQRIQNVRVKAPDRCQKRYRMRQPISSNETVEKD